MFVPGRKGVRPWPAESRHPRTRAPTHLFCPGQLVLAYSPHTRQAAALFSGLLSASREEADFTERDRRFEKHQRVVGATLSHLPAPWQFFGAPELITNQRCFPDASVTILFLIHDDWVSPCIPTRISLRTFLIASLSLRLLFPGTCGLFNPARSEAGRVHVVWLLLSESHDSPECILPLSTRITTMAFCMPTFTSGDTSLLLVLFMISSILWEPKRSR